MSAREDVVIFGRHRDGLDAGLMVQTWLEDLAARWRGPPPSIERFGLRMEDPSAIPNGHVTVVWAGGWLAGVATVVRDDLNFSVVTIVEKQGHALSAAPAPSPRKGTPAADWREQEEPDPHGTRYDCERARLARGDATDDALANAVFLDPNIVNLTAAKDRIRWLSRALVRAVQDGDTARRDVGSVIEDTARELGCEPDNEAILEAIRRLRFQPLGDNHHNAEACPYCNPERLQLIDPSETDRLRAEVASLREQLAKAGPQGREAW